MSSARRLLAQAVAQRRVPPHAVDYAVLRLRQPWAAATRRLRRLARRRQRRATVRAVTASGRRDLTFLLADGRWQVAAPFRHISVRDVANEHLAAVARLLESAGVPYFVRDAAGPGSATVGVGAEHRRSALAALREAPPAEWLYALCDPDGIPIPLGHGGQVPGGLAGARRLLVYRNHRVGREYVVGASHACVVEFWERAGRNLRAPKGGQPGRFVPAEVEPAEARVGGRSYPTLSTFADHQALSATTDFPVDAVFTWVDDTDPRWRARLAEETARVASELHPEATNVSRYRDRDELRYSLRSLALYAPFVRRVFVVTAGQVPSWLDRSHPGVTVVDHAEILPPECLPTFNSHAIESRLHHIDGLAEHYLYLNDDFLLGREAAATTFFTPNGLARLFVDERAPIPAGPPSLTDRPVDAASKNVRDLLRAHLGVRVGRKILDVPYPQRRSVLTEMEQRFPEEFARTARSRFRQATDVNVASCFSHYYAYATGRAVPGEIAAEYVNVATRWAPLQLRRLLARRDRDAACLNETDLAEGRVGAVRAMTDRFLRAYLPVASPYELPATPESGAEPEPADHVGESVESR